MMISPVDEVAIGAAVLSRAAMGVFKGAANLVKGAVSWVKATKAAKTTLQFAEKVSAQKQMRHIKGTAPENKSYLDSLEDAQKVLDNLNSGNYKLIGENVKQSTVTIKVDNVTGRYVNVGNPNGLPDVNVRTNVFMIQSLKSPKIVPVNPNKGL
jgi:hypothetical protein